MKKTICLMLALAMLFLFGSCKRESFLDKLKNNNTATEEASGEEPGSSAAAENGVDGEETTGKNDSNVYESSETTAFEETSGVPVSETATGAADETTAPSTTEKPTDPPSTTEKQTDPPSTRQSGDSAPSLIGKWVGSLDMGNYRELQEFMPGMSFKTDIKTVFEFDKSGTMTVSYDKKSIEAAESKLLDSLIKYMQSGGLRKMLETGELDDMDAEMIALIEGMLNGPGGGALIKQLMGDEFKGILTDCFAEYYESGGCYVRSFKYKAEDGMIFPDEASAAYLLYSFSGSVLTLSVTDAGSLAFEFFDTMKLTKQ